MRGEFWFMLLLISFRLLSSVNSSNVRCYSSTDGEWGNPGFCTTRLYCHNGSLVPNAAKCKNGEKCCILQKRGKVQRSGLRLYVSLPKRDTQLLHTYTQHCIHRDANIQPLQLYAIQGSLGNPEVFEYCMHVLHRVSKKN